MKFNVLGVGSLVYVTSSGPCWGLKGIIRAVDVIALVDTQAPLYFYLVAFCGKELSAWGKIMSDTITQTRLSMRLDAYLREYTGENIGKEAPSKAEWDTAWRVADVARTQNMLTPEIVDDVRKALQKL